MYIHLNRQEARFLDHLTHLAFLLMRGGRYPVRQLVQAMDVSQGSVYRWLDSLEDFGLLLKRERRKGYTVFSLDPQSLRKIRKHLRKHLLGRKVNSTMVAIAMHPPPSIDETVNVRLFKLAYLATADARWSLELVRAAELSPTPLKFLIRKLEDELPPPADFYELEYGLRVGTTIPINADTSYNRLLVWELTHRCLARTLQSVSIHLRITYLLADVLGIKCTEVASLSGLKETAVRVRLTRARAAVVALLGPRCSFLDANNPCTCTSRLGVAIRSEIVGRPTLPTPDHVPTVVKRPRQPWAIYRHLPILPPRTP